MRLKPGDVDCRARWARRSAVPSLRGLRAWTQLDEKYIGRWRWNTSKWVRVPGKRARRQLTRPESEHVVREYPELAIVDRATWDRVRARLARRKAHDTQETLFRGQRVYMLSGLLRCGACNGPMSVTSQQQKAGVRYVQFGCTAHSSRGGSICSNSMTISERKITEAFVEKLTETLSIENVMSEFEQQFEADVTKQRAAGPKELERELRAAEARVTSATRLMIEMPDDLDIRRQREADQAEVRQLTAEIAARATAAAIPNKKEIAKVAKKLLAAVADAAPERAREALATALTPLILTPKRVGPDYLVEVVGSLELTAPAEVGAVVRSGGRI